MHPQVFSDLLADESISNVFSEKTISIFYEKINALGINYTTSVAYRMKSEINSTCIIHDDLIIKGSLVTGDNVRIGRNVRIEGNIIISSNVVINDDCFLRGDVFLGLDVRLGRSVEIKDCLIGNASSIGPLSFLGDSILGEKAYLGALVRTSNERLDRGTIQLWIGKNKIEVGSKFGCIIGDNVQIGLQSSIMPGRVIPKGSILPPLTVFKTSGQLLHND